MQLVVLGVHRSGTSALTRLMNLMGMYVGTEGTTVSFGVENEKGYWERHDVIALNDELLRHYDCEWNDLLHWQERSQKEVPQALQHRIKEMLLEMDHHRPWVMKDPRMCQTFPMWRAQMEVPLVVMVWRDPVEVALSLRKTRDIPLQHGLAIWEHCTRSALAAAQGVPHLIVSHNDIMQQPLAVTKRVYEWCIEQNVQAIHLPTDEEVLAFIDPSMHRAKAAELDLPVADEVRMLQAYLQQPTAAPEIPPLSALSQQAFELYHATRVLFDEKERIRHFSDDQAERIRELEAQNDALHQDLQDWKVGWRLSREEWDALLGRLNEFEASTREDIEFIRYSGLIGTLRRWLGKKAA